MSASDNRGMITGITQAISSIAKTASKSDHTLHGAGARFSDIHREQPTGPAAVPSSGPLAAAGKVPPTAPTSAPTAVGQVERAVTDMVRGKQALDRGIRRAMRGEGLNPSQLLVLQVQAQRYALQVETASRVVDKVAGAVKQTLQTQV